MVNVSRNVSAAVLAALSAPLLVVSAPALAQEASASGEVRKVEVPEGKVMIKHGPIAELGLPAMTLVYRVDPALMAGINPGDKVSFTARRQDSQYVIIKISK